MDPERPTGKSYQRWFIGIQVYDSQGSLIWVPRGPFDHSDHLDRAQSQLKAIDKPATEPFQAASIEEALMTCRTFGLNGKPL